MSDAITETYDGQTIQDLAQFTGFEPEICIQRLQSYQLEEMAEAWWMVQPRSPEDIRRFYEDTDLYVWELTNWTSSAAYDKYWNMVDALIKRFPPHRYPRVIDYGSGVGAVALRLAEAGYQVTLADVAGKTLEYAEFRMRRRGYQFESVRIMDERPKLPHDYDIFISFDVFEHIPHPDHLLMHLMRWLRPGGVAAIVATFQTYDTHPHHLPDNSQRVATMWPLVIRASGLDPLGPELFVRVGRRRTVLRRLRYLAWQKTGLYVIHSHDPGYISRAVG